MLIFDEPTTAMGLKETAVVLKLINSLVQNGFAAIMISHDMDILGLINTSAPLELQNVIIDFMNFDKTSKVQILEEVINPKTDSLAYHALKRYYRVDSNSASEMVFSLLMYGTQK